jgi:hypothetical protein
LTLWPQGTTQPTVATLNALDGAIGFAPDDRDRVHVDYLWERRSFQEEHLLLHYGVGAAIGLGGHADQVAFYAGDTYYLRTTDLGFALRGVVGLTYEFPRSPFDAFAEIAPLFIVTPVGGLGLDAALGVRIYP